MNNNEIILQIKRLLESSFAVEKRNSGHVNKDFFDSIELKKKARSTLKMLEEMMGYPHLNDERFEYLYDLAQREAKHENQRGMTSPSISLTDNSTSKIWLDTQRIEQIGWNEDGAKTYRTRYLEYLKKIGRTKDYIKETDRSSLEIVKKLGDPKSNDPFYVRGLVVGSVQSGKTSNFNAVINSAIDVGYDLIIVLSGIMEDLRVQTQKRIEKEVEGKYENGAFIGVGACTSFGQVGDYSNVHQIVVPTSQETDFKKTIKEADFSLNSRNILVCKKNTSVLKNLLLWLQRYLHKNRDKIDIPFLIIDDEADNASLNNLGVKGREYASIINGHIRALLGLFHKKTYLGYTATPFGNVLQDRNKASDIKWIVKDGDKEQEFSQVDSLFPNDFIELLFPPPNYIGAKHFFETRLDEIKKIEPLVAQPITDHNNAFPSRVTKEEETPTTEIGKHTRATTKYDSFPQYLPDSLKEAIMCFALSTAIRLTRKSAMQGSALYQPHNTMLIHISRFTTWQSRTKTLVQKYIEDILNALENDQPNSKNSIYGEFERCWYKYYAYIVENIWSYLPEDYEDPFLESRTFSDVKPFLISAVKKIETKAVNSDEKDQLLYPDETDKEFREKVYIAIGGNRLSRGFTLEGLTINYFVRNTNFADTLLQMGRWFGYRPGYIDCCKLFSNSESLEKFDQTTATIEDLEQRFIEMNRDPSNTPNKFALKVLTHPGVLKITRPSILKNSVEVRWSYSDHLEQTTKFQIEKNRLENAWNAFKSLVRKYGDQFKPVFSDRKKLEYLEYHPESVENLFEFLDLPNSFNGHGKGENYFEQIKTFITLCNEKNKLRNWSIAIKATGNGRPLSLNELGLEYTIDRAHREGPGKNAMRWRETLIKEHLFAAGGSSANIVTGGKDLALRLSKEQIKIATEEFKENWALEQKKKFPSLSGDEINSRKDKLNVPEKAYRQEMTDDEGVLIIYLMDLNLVFEHGGEPIDEIQHLKNSIDTDNIPLIGYAIGTPIIDSSIGGNYLQSSFHEELETEETDENDLPEDRMEA
ncbi:MAG: Z1 domain-containing protein [Bacteriovoracaceae bacterium]|nr:Z1 domain-containing protein [Bacteriovoracaceae bacterium]